MPQPFLAQNHAQNGVLTIHGSGGGRNYDYRKAYLPDKEGEEGKENARVWNVYLDEVNIYDSDMIQGLRDIIDGLLVFAALFSAVVTTFVAQTSQTLQSNNTQIAAQLLVENNQLLRALATGNSTLVNAVPPAPLKPGDPTHSPTDVWVNALFFVSLVLSLSTALFSVLVKQWLHGYTSMVLGAAKDRVLIRHFRFKGVIRWKLQSIVETLPLVLHASVAAFLIGLALLVSELHRTITWGVVSIAAITFTAYIGTAVLPAFYVDCPYRVPLLFLVARYLGFIYSAAKYAFLWLLWISTLGIVQPSDWPTSRYESLKEAEYRAVFPCANSADVFFGPNHLACDALWWLFSHSSNPSVKEIAIHGLSGLLQEWRNFLTHNQELRIDDFLSIKRRILRHDLIPAAVIFSLRQLAASDAPGKEIWTNVIKLVLYADSIRERLLDCTFLHRFRRQIQDELNGAFRAVLLRGDLTLAQTLRKWGSKIPSESQDVLLVHELADRGHAEAIRYLAQREKANIDQEDHRGFIPLHFACSSGQLEAVKALVENGASLSAVSHNNMTPLGLATKNGRDEVVEYLLDHGARFRPGGFPLHVAAVQPNSPTLVTVLLDRGFDRTTQCEGQTPYEVALQYQNQEAAFLLQNYVTVPVWTYEL